MANTSSAEEAIWKWTSSGKEIGLTEIDQQSFSTLFEFAFFSRKYIRSETCSMEIQGLMINWCTCVGRGIRGILGVLMAVNYLSVNYP